MKKTLSIQLLILFAMAQVAFSQTVQESVQKLHDNAAALENIVNGPATGQGANVQLPGGGSQITVAKALAQINTELTKQVFVQFTATTLSNLGLADYPNQTILVMPDGNKYQLDIDATFGPYAASGGGYWELYQGVKNSKAILILAEGQSNMVGYGGKIYDANDYPLPNMFQLSKGDDRGDVYDEGLKYDFITHFQPAQTTQIREPRDTVSIDFYFARRMAQDYPDYDIYVVKNAWGGTSFASGRWAEGGDLRARGVAELRFAYEKLVADPQYDVVLFAGKIWHQGESDSFTTANANAYAGRLTNLFSNQRLDLSGLGFGDYPIIVGTMVPQWIGNVTDRLTIDTAHRNIASVVTNSGFADLADTTDPADTIHFGADDLEIAGNRYYEVWKTLLSQVNSTVKPVENIISLTAENGVLVSNTPYTLQGSGPSVVGDVMYFADGRGGLRYGQKLPIGKNGYTKIVHLFYGQNQSGRKLDGMNLISGYPENGYGGIPWYWNALGTDLQVSNNTPVSPYDNIAVDKQQSGFGEWVTLAVTWQDGVLKLYNQSGLVAQSDEPDVLDILATNVSFGFWDELGQNELESAVKFMGVYSGAMSLAQIQEVHNTFYQQDPVDLTDGLIADYQFTSDQSDSSGNGNNGANTNLPTFSNGVATFTNTNYITLPLLENQVRTRVAKYRTTNHTQSKNLISGAGAGVPFWDRVGDLIATGNPVQVKQTESAQTVVNTANGEWHVAATSYDPQTNMLTLYLNGDLVGYRILNQTLSSANLLIGRYNASTNNFIGDMDWAKLYDRPLNHEEMKAITSTP